MKTIITFFASLTCVFTFGTHSAQAQSATPSTLNPLFATDITIEVNNQADQRHVRVASAFNGWLFAAYIVNDSTSGKGGVVVRYSKNGGINWLPFNGYAYYQHSFYSSCDIAVAGNDTTHLGVYVGVVRKDLVSKKYEVTVEKYNPYKISFPPVLVFSQKLDTNKVTDMALASNAKLTALPKDSIFSVGLLYAHHGTSMDSLIFASIAKKSGPKFGKHTLVASGKYYRKVALSFAHSQTVAGSYCAAWEQDSTVKSTLGHIFTSRTKWNADSLWTAPTLLDTLFPNMSNHVRNPSISSQYSLTDNDSGNVTVAVAFECARNGITDSMDILGAYNKRGDSTNFWNSFRVAGTTNNELQPNIYYDGNGNNFMVTYYDSTAGGLSYVKQGSSLTTPNAWTLVNAAYNNNPTMLKAPWPRVVLNQLTNKAFFAWTVDPINNNGIVMCDGEYLFTSTGPELDLNGIKVYNLYPNPSSTSALLPVSSDRAVDVSLSVFNILGENSMPVRIQHLPGGMQYLELDVTSLASGIYLCRIQSGTMTHTVRFVVQR
jgi:hypothetical protein